MTPPRLVKPTLISQWLLLLTAILCSSLTQAAGFTNSIGMQFKTLAAGSFYMGSCKLSAADKAANKKRQFMGLPAQAGACPSGAGADKDAFDYETPQHKVRISKRFKMGVHEVTLGQFKQFIIGAGRDDLLSDDFIQYNSHGNSAAVTYVSYNDVQAFIRWLNKKEGGQAYRLPTEAEWEYAARAGSNTRYSWGDSSSAAGSYAWYRANARDRGQEYAHAVGTKKANAWGLYDMHGNVYEWVQDCWNDSYHGAPSTGTRRVSGDCNSAVLRGGSWGTYDNSLRSAYRSNDTRSSRNDYFGFRLAQD